MEKFFKYLIYANGILLLFLTLFILADIWILQDLADDLTWKALGSYILLLINFVIFYKLKTLSRQQETDHYE